MKNVKTLPLEAGGSSNLALADRFVEAASHVIFNKEHEFKLALTCFLARGHLLIEDLPGVGKTTFVKTLAKLLGLNMGRIQFTNDLLPGDIIGTSIYDSQEKRFRFHRGPIFSSFILIDELNRATPKTQSALLQAMEERQVTVEGESHNLPQPFFLVATQNPRFQLGTFSLPESQLDRFMMRIQLGYPGAEAEKKLLMGNDRQEDLENLQPLMTPKEVEQMMVEAAHVHVSDDLAQYIQNILEASRQENRGLVGLSPRAGLSLIGAAKAWAWLAGRKIVLPEDVQAVCVGVVNHRISPSESTYRVSASLAQDLVKSIEVT